MRAPTTPTATAPAPAPAGRRAPVDVLIVGVFVVVATVGQLVRQRGAPVWDTVWGEDGALYTYDAQRKAIVDALLSPYRSYLQLLPRVLALPTRWLPLDADAAYLAVSAALATSLLAVFVYWAAGTQLHTRWPRLLLIIAMVWAPTMLFESTANIANVIWALLFAGFWAVIAASDGRAPTVARTSVALVAVLSNALALAYLPLAALLAYKRRDRGDSWVAGALALGGIVQVIVATTNPATPKDGTNSVGDLVGIFSGRVLNRLFVGDVYAERLWLRFGWWWAVACVVVLVLTMAWFVHVARASRVETRWLAGAAVLYALVLFTAPIWLRGTSPMRLSADAFNLAGARFETVPALLLISAAVLALGDVRWAANDRVRLVTSIVLTVQVLVVVGIGFSGRNFRSDGPRWSDELAVAEQECMTTGAEDVAIEHTPAPFWFVVVDCDRVLP